MKIKSSRGELGRLGEAGYRADPSSDCPIFLTTNHNMLMKQKQKIYQPTHKQPVGSTHSHHQELTLSNNQEKGKISFLSLTEILFYKYSETENPWKISHWRS